MAEETDTLPEPVDADTQEQDQTDYSELNDDEFINMDFSEGESVEDPAEDSSDDDSTDDDETEEEDDVEKQEEDEEEDEQESEENTDESEEDEQDEDDSAVNYEEEYKRLLKPFKANGKEIAVSNVDEAIQLMQMGANYNKKMIQLKPYLKQVKMLERNDLLDESKLSFLIDLSKGTPEAINKLLQDHQLDSDELDASSGEEYKARDYSINDAELAIETVLDEIKDSPGYSKTLNTVSKIWDDRSRQIVAETPELLRVINEHVENGIFDIIEQQLDKERMFGRMSGLSDIEAYKKVGEALQASGKLGTAPRKGTVVTPKTKDNSQLKSKRKAASTSRKAPEATQPAIPNDGADLSDEEFLRVAKAARIYA